MTRCFSEARGDGLRRTALFSMLARLASRSTRLARPSALAPMASRLQQRGMAMGPASGGEVSDELLDKLGTLSTQSLIDGLWVMGWPDATIEGARPLGKGQKCVGRAVTLRFAPQRPDLAADKPVGVESPEYEAFELCGPRNVLVMSSVGPWESVGGDIKFLRLKQLGLGGLVTDGSVRDTDEILAYGFPTWSFSTTPKQGPAAMQPWECNGVISCGKVLVRPGDAIIGDQDGVVVVPASHAQQVYDIAHGREVVEEIIKAELVASTSPLPGASFSLHLCRALALFPSRSLTHWSHSAVHRPPSPLHSPTPSLACLCCRLISSCACLASLRRPWPPGQVLSVQAADQARVAARQAPHLEGRQVPLHARGYLRQRWPPPHVFGPGDDEGGVKSIAFTCTLPRAATMRTTSCASGRARSRRDSPHPEPKCLHRPTLSEEGATWGSGRHSRWRWRRVGGKEEEKRERRGCGSFRI